MPSSAIHVLWLCRRPWGVSPSLTGSQQAREASSEGCCTSGSQFVLRYESSFGGSRKKRPRISRSCHSTLISVGRRRSRSRPIVSPPPHPGIGDREKHGELVVSAGQQCRPFGCEQYLKWCCPRTLRAAVEPATRPSPAVARPDSRVEGDQRRPGRSGVAEDGVQQAARIPGRPTRNPGGGGQLILPDGDLLASKRGELPRAPVRPEEPADQVPNPDNARSPPRHMNVCGPPRLRPHRRSHPPHLAP